LHPRAPERFKRVVDYFVKRSRNVSAQRKIYVGRRRGRFRAVQLCARGNGETIVERFNRSFDVDRRKAAAFASDDSAGGVCAPLVRGCGEAGGKVEYDSFSFDASSPLFFGRVEIKPVKKAQSVKVQPKFDSTAWIKRIL